MFLWKKILSLISDIKKNFAPCGVFVVTVVKTSFHVSVGRFRKSFFPEKLNFLGSFWTLTGKKLAEFFGMFVEPALNVSKRTFSGRKKF